MSGFPNRFGGRENLEAINFLTALNGLIKEHPGCFMVAEESTAWPGVTRRVPEGGWASRSSGTWAGCTTPCATSRAGPGRIGRYHQDDLTFAMLYEYERFVMPLSHDEVVHEGSLLAKMAGDRWQKFANLRLLLAYQYTRPGKAPLFMGTEIAADAQ